MPLRIALLLGACMIVGAVRLGTGFAGNQFRVRAGGPSRIQHTELQWRTERK